MLKVLQNVQSTFVASCESARKYSCMERSSGQSFICTAYICYKLCFEQKTNSGSSMMHRIGMHTHHSRIVGSNVKCIFNNGLKSGSQQNLEPKKIYIPEDIFMSFPMMHTPPFPHSVLQCKTYNC